MVLGRAAPLLKVTGKISGVSSTHLGLFKHMNNNKAAIQMFNLFIQLHISSNVLQLLIKISTVWHSLYTLADIHRLTATTTVRVWWGCKIHQRELTE